MVSWLTEVPYSSIWKLKENELENMSCGVRKKGGHGNLAKLSSRLKRIGCRSSAFSEALLYPYNLGKIKLI